MKRRRKDVGNELRTRNHKYSIRTYKMYLAVQSEVLFASAGAASRRGRRARLPREEMHTNVTERGEGVAE
jgi:hypothetical protein